MPPSTNGVPLSVLSLRQRERGFLAGGTESGKSTLADLIGEEFIQRYAAKKARRLILDSKPRYRAEWTAHGTSAKRRYKKWDHGAAPAGSCVIDKPSELAGAFDLDYRTVIIQGESVHDIPRLTEAADLFLRSSRAGRPQLLQVDETMDYFFVNGSPRGGNDAIVRAARAGRERGTACLFCTQRTRNLPANLMSEMTRAYVFRMDYANDLKRLTEFGMPVVPNLKQKWRFWYWYKEAYEDVFGPYQLALPRSA